MTDRELLQQALEALDYEAERGNDDGYRQLRDALRERLLQPEREWVGLTDEEMHECWGDPLTPLGMTHARMIEAKLKEKNT